MEKRKKSWSLLNIDFNLGKYDFLKYELKFAANNVFFKLIS